MNTKRSAKNCNRERNVIANLSGARGDWLIGEIG